MDVNSFIQAVTTVGFPIVCCGAMMWYVKYATDKNREDVMSLNEMHKQEVAEVTKALNNNTLVIQKLVDKLEAGDIKIDEFQNS